MTETPRNDTPLRKTHPYPQPLGIVIKAITSAIPHSGEDDSQAWAAEGPHALASLRNLALGLFRLKNANSIKETTEWICRDRIRGYFSS